MFDSTALLELNLPLPRAAAGAALLAALLALLAGGLKLRLLLAGEHVVHLVHHARLRHLALDLRVGARLRGGADGRLVERAAAQARANAQVEREVAQARMMFEMYNVLTAEQKAQLQAARQQREQRRQEFRTRRGAPQTQLQ